MIGRDVIGILWCPRGATLPRPPAGSRLSPIAPDQVADFALARRRAPGRFYLAERDPPASDARAVLWCGIALAVAVLLCGVLA